MKILRRDLVMALAAAGAVVATGCSAVTQWTPTARPPAVEDTSPGASPSTETGTSRGGEIPQTE